MYWARLFFSFRGRVNRAGFWIVSLTWLALAAVLAIVWASSGVSTLLLDGNDPVALGGILVAIPVIASSFAVCVRRLHDRDKSALWLLLFLLCPAVMDALGSVGTLDAAPAVGLMVLSRAIGIWAFVELGCLPGSAGTNRYGPDPLAGAAV